MSRNLPPITANINQWAENMRRYLGLALDQLGFKDTSASAGQDGVLLWDAVAGYPVVSKNGGWHQIVLEDGHANFIKTAGGTAALANTAYKLTYDAPVGNSGITQGTPASRIVFEESGEYVLAFSAQMSSTSTATVHFYFWPSINGTDVPNSALATALHRNNATVLTSRTQIFTVAAGDYIEVNYMFDSTTGFLNYTAASSPVPAIPASTLSITRLHG